MAGLDRETVRERIRAAIGEPSVSRRGFEVPETMDKPRSRVLHTPGSLPRPLQVPAFAALVAAVVVVVGVGTLVGLRAHIGPSPSVSPSGPPAGPPRVEGFVPADVTAVSTDEWWVAGADQRGCSGVKCSRILWTIDAGSSFSSLPPPPIIATNLRFANPRDGWAYDRGSTTVYATHDGGMSWAPVALGGAVDDLQASGGNVYAIVCGSAPGCALERSPVSAGEWVTLPTPAGVGEMANLNVHGSELWVAADAGASLLTSADDGANFSRSSPCPAGTSISSLNAATADVLWATCSSPAVTDVLLSTNAGRSFTAIALGLNPSWDSIAGPSAGTAALGGQALELERTIGGGRSWAQVLDTGAVWTVVGFTTDQVGFALATSSGVTSLWRTDDAGTAWYQIAFSAG